ncbi:Hemolysin-type calcium-binding repeat (2 copies) [Seminavis robusta]|uniref:Hemolysin-type calcium-binding repeat (2 copies) n=1 Tax=Seminavis robusta TaxID=568900 RepID=A0A9N8HCK8_9STRA|nr:Hemolysin-type calcium-binding repeat (2 copies) [Seminavis robusta]|eukprot:Sro222_g091190.1 Hemolysin-type calcium-binding repeat (2 copies) (904) ;mRNA; r:56044-58755
MVSYRRGWFLLFALSQCHSVATESPQRLRVKGTADVPPKQKNARDKLVQVENIQKDDGKNTPASHNLRRLESRIQQETERKTLQLEDELMFELFFPQGEGSYDTLPAETAAPVPQTPNPKPYRTPAPATSNPPFSTPPMASPTTPANLPPMASPTIPASAGTPRPTSKPTSEPTERPTTPIPTSNPTERPTTPKPTPSPTKAPATPKPTPRPTKAPTPNPPDPTPPPTPEPVPSTPKPTKAPTAPVPPPTASPPLRCGCADCTNERWNTLAGGFSCGERIVFVIGMGSTEEAACRLVAGSEWPDTCGPFCDPDRCDENGRTDTSAPILPAAPAPTPPAPTPTTPAASPTTPAEAPQTYCGCDECTEEIWNTMVGLFTCGELIESVMSVPRQQACGLIAGINSEFSGYCYPCDPARCDGKVPPTPSPSLPAPVPASPAPTPAPTLINPMPGPTRCGCPACGGATLDQLAGDFTCLARIDFLMSTGQSEEDACRLVAGSEFGDVCGPNCDPDRCEGYIPVTLESLEPTITPFPTPAPKCGCDDCAQAWGLLAGDSTCGERIQYLMDAGSPEEEACRLVASVEFPFICGPSCDPDRCDDNNPALEPRTPLYCFPPYDERQRYENVWGNYIVEVKEDDSLGVCDPSFNRFTSEMVEVNGDELTLRFKKNGDMWEAGEVRIVMPEEEMPFDYGTYSWNVKSIELKNVDTGVVRQDFLPPNMVFGMFTWDATEDFSIRENYSHEVDIELGRFEDADSPNDAHFIMQPAIDSNMYSFSTALDDGTFQQAPHSYSFTWNPGAITWETTAGGGVDHFYTTEQAVVMDEEDYIQCLPADVEVRINLWSLGGALAAPMEMADDEMIEVVVDNFSFTPTGRTGIPDGGFCSKDCQCQGGSECSLVTSVCTPMTVS